MTCSEELVAALLAGELEPEERSALDTHLLGCAACWQAVQEDRAGRLAVEQLRDPAPPGLADRVRLAVELAGASSPPPHGVAARQRTLAQKARVARRPADPARGAARPARTAASRRIVLVAAACLLVAGLAAGLSAALVGPGRVSDPPVVRAIAAMADQPGGGPGRLAATHRSEHMVLDGQPVTIGAYRVEGVLTVVAVSSSPFAMPDSSHVVHGSSHHAWMATRDGVGLWCVNAPPGRHSMLVAARMPAVQLPAVVSGLDLSAL